MRTERHPLIRFHGGASGHLRPLVIGTRLYVHQVINTLRGNDGNLRQTAEYFGIRPFLVRAALAYYIDFKDEVDADADTDDRFAEAERARWERQQQAQK